MMNDNEAKHYRVRYIFLSQIVSDYLNIFCKNLLHIANDFSLKNNCFVTVNWILRLKTLVFSLQKTPILVTPIY